MKKILTKMLPKRIKKIYHYCLGAIAYFLNYDPTPLKVIGVTGTDGKTTTTHIISRILSQNGDKVALCNGISLKIGNDAQPNNTGNSTPGPFVFHSFMLQAKKRGCRYLVVESTSWGLSMYRLWGVSFDVAVVTNFTHEHLDLHGKKQAYLQAKGNLFAALKSNGENSVAVINKDDSSSEFFDNFPAKVKLHYSLKKYSADVYAKNIKLSSQNSDFDIVWKGKSHSVHLSLPGMFNVANTLAAVCVCRSQNVSWDDIIKALKNLPAVPGRFNYVNCGQSFSIIVDYAHTPNAFKNVFQSVKQIFPQAKITAVFGSAGGRDIQKRPSLGKIAAKWADKIILTEDDPRQEDPRQIANQIIKGISKTPNAPKYEFIANRALAVKTAISQAKKGDVVLLLSMGHDTVIYRGKIKSPWSDVKEAHQALIDCGYTSK